MSSPSTDLTETLGDELEVLTVSADSQKELERHLTVRHALRKSLGVRRQLGLGPETPGSASGSTKRWFSCQHDEGDVR